MFHPCTVSCSRVITRVIRMMQNKMGQRVTTASKPQRHAPWGPHCERLLVNPDPLTGNGHAGSFWRCSGPVGTLNHLGKSLVTQKLHCATWSYIAESKVFKKLATRLLVKSLLCCSLYFSWGGYISSGDNARLRCFTFRECFLCVKHCPIANNSKNADS